MDAYANLRSVRNYIRDHGDAVGAVLLDIDTYELFEEELHDFYHKRLGDYISLKVKHPPTPPLCREGIPKEHYIIRNVPVVLFYK